MLPEEHIRSFNSYPLEYAPQESNMLPREAYSFL